MLTDNRMDNGSAKGIKSGALVRSVPFGGEKLCELLHAPKQALIVELGNDRYTIGIAGPPDLCGGLLTLKPLNDTFTAETINCKDIAGVYCVPELYKLGAQKADSDNLTKPNILLRMRVKASIVTNVERLKFVEA